jgi:hypothetical protein
VIADCTLSVGGLREQESRAVSLRREVESVERGPGSLAVTFGAGVDRAVIDELIEVERGCCAFLAIGYDEHARVLSIGVEDRRHADVLDAFGAFFGQEAAA